MKATMYITRTGEMIDLGKPARVTLYEFPEVSRVWIRRVVVELPDGFSVGESNYGEPLIVRDGERMGFELAATVNDDPVIVDHTDNGKCIPLPILSEGWDE